MKISLVTSPRAIYKYKKVIQNNYLCYLDGAINTWLSHRFPIKAIGLSLSESDNMYTGTVVALDNIIDAEFQCNIGVYVLPTFRKKGIGRALIQKLQRRLPMYKIIPWTGISGARHFYKEVLQ